MCNLGEGLARRYEQQGKQKGIQETNAHSIKAIMDNLNLDLDQAMSLLNIDLSQKSKYEKLINS